MLTLLAGFGVLAAVGCASTTSGSNDSGSLGSNAAPAPIVSGAAGNAAAVTPAGIAPANTPPAAVTTPPATTAPAATGSGTVPAPPATAATTATWCGALGVIRSNCQTCHGTQRMFGAPMSMVTYDDLQKPAVSDATKKVYQLVGVRIHATTSPMPPVNYPRLAAQDISTLDGWIAGGATAGADPTCAALPAAPPPAVMTDPNVTAATAPPGTTLDADGFPWPNDCEKHYKLVAYASTQGDGQKASVGAGQEVHPQFMFTPPWQGNVQAVAWKPIVDNTKVLHHWILYAADGAFLTGWAPGANGSKNPLPLDTGMYAPSSGQMRMDTHYNNLAGTQTEMDASGVEVCTIETQSKFRPNTATVIGIAGDATAPAHQRVDNSTTCTVTASMGNATLISNSPHMHKLGVHAKLVLNQGGQDQVLHDDVFSFDEQHTWPLNPHVVVKSGDKFTVTCSYQNDSDVNVSFGQNTEDEMCFNFVTVYPMGGFSCGAGAGGGGFFGF